MTALFAARLLGRVEFLAGNQPLADLGLKERALLAYLLYAPGIEHRRETLAGLLWGERESARARDSLKHTIAGIRSTLGAAADDLLNATRTTVSIHAETVDTDVSSFLSLAQQDQGEKIAEALDLYRGDLMQDITLDEPGFDEWLSAERGKIRRAADYVVSRTLAFCAEDDDPATSIAAARKALDIDPQNERACRLLMRALTETGERSLAIATFKRFVADLDEALGIEPEVETVALFEQLTASSGNLSGPGAVEAGGGGKHGLAGKPGVAVLAFKALGVEDYVADGVTEEVVTALSRVRGISLIAHGSSFSYRDSAVPAGDVGQELGVQYMVEGKIMRQGEQVRLFVSLLDAKARQIIWSDTFAGERNDLFSLQERIAAQVAGVLLPKVEVAEISRLGARRRAREDAYDHYLRGLSHLHRWTEEDSLKAIAEFAEATRLEPDFASAHAMAVRCYSLRKASGWVRDRAQETSEAARLSRMAADLAGDDALPLAMAAIGFGFVAGEPEKGVRLVERALQLNPNLAYAWFFSGWINVWLGLHETAIEHFATAMRLSPQDPQFAMMQGGTACGHLLANRPESAMTWAERAVASQPHYWIAWCVLAAARVNLGDLKGAQETFAHVKAIDPDLSAANLLDVFPLRRPEDIRNWTDALRRAGLPG